MPELYDEIGRTYSSKRRPEPAIEAAILAALGACEPVLNVGAGVGSYEPNDRYVVAAEPSWTMLAQRAPNAAAAVQSRSETLPFADKSFGAVLGVLTLHHWAGLVAGLKECARVAHDRCVFLTFDVEAMRHFWLLDYFPNILAVDAGKSAGLDRFADVFAQVAVSSVPIPADCRDGFLGAYWRKPDAYLDEAVRAAISAFAKIGSQELQQGVTRLARDLGDGTWHRRHGDLLACERLDLGYRLVVCRQ